MRKWILIFLPLTLWGQALRSQDVVGCTQLLEDAKEAYAAGMVELVPDLLNPCLEPDGLTGPSRLEAYKLVINAYLFDYLPDEAGNLMERFVDEYPDYRAGPDDPAEFELLLDSKLRERGIDPEQEVSDAVEEEVTTAQQQQERARQMMIKPPFEYGHSIGFTVGGSVSFPQMVERYSIGDPADDEGTFGMQPGFQVGMNMNLRLGNVVETSFGLLFHRTGFTYDATPISFTSYEYVEHENRLQLPVTFNFRLNPRARRVSVYLRAGIEGDYLISASGSGVRSYSVNLKDVEVDNVDVKDSRTTLNLNGLAGIGVRIPMENSFFFIESRYTTGLFLVNNKENRYDNQELIWPLYHVDSDFRMQQVSLLAGISWNL